MGINISTAWKILYGLLFVVFLPLMLLLWAKSTEPLVPLPMIGSSTIGVVLALCGLIIMITGMVSIVIYGEGVPMNAFPPRRYVSRGIYHLTSHPIYAGFSLSCVGVAIALQSPSGLWLVSTIVVLGCVALVQGLEKHDLTNRFGYSLPKPILSLPPNEERTPKIAERISVYCLVLLPWLMLYEAVAMLGIPADAIVGLLPFEKHLPVYEWTELFYGGTYLFVFLVPIIATSARSLREFSIAGLIATSLVILLFVVLPVTAPPREFVPHGVFGQLMMWERRLDTPAAAFPSFHVIWAFLAARAFSGAFPKMRMLWWLCASLISASCVTTGMHSIADILAGALVAWIVVRSGTAWEMVRLLAERIANSWKEWRIGPVRIINHGLYAGVGTALGLLMIGIFLGADSVLQISTVGFCSLIVAALWAQFVEGSPSLLRPYGFYGGVIGAVLGALLARVFGGDPFLLLAAFSVAGPLIQSMGRLRCLVQGCCHGREAPANVGIRYTHPRSRVCRLANLAGVPIHPTPLYSILWNLVVGVVLLRLWCLQASPTMIAGLYLILNGLGRFVEESYRGEPQTPILGKLRLYQIMAIAGILSGIVLTALRTSSVVPVPQFNWTSVLMAAGFGFVTWFALGLDFPNSNRRFARLV
jgi:membrane-associated phospholipid phosphatase/protein-S-isoprenylcysteine O-methyltransferase Ste14